MNKSKFFGSRPVFFLIDDVAGAGGGAAIADAGDTGGGSDDSALDLGVGTEGDDAGDGTEKTSDIDDTAGEVRQDADTNRNDDKARDVKEEPELKDFRGIASGRIRGLIKQVPALGDVFSKHPNIKDTIEGVFRREAALTEIFPTIAEARAMRDQFPSGQADVQALLDDVKEIEEIDNNFDVKGQDGSYPGHAKLIDNFFQRDKTAAISLLKTVPKEWARLDRESYNEVMGKVVAATLASREIPERIQAMLDAVDEAEQPQLKAELKKMLGWANSYMADKPKPSAEEERLANDRREFDRTKNQSSKEAHARFHSSFVAESAKLQREVINGHKAVQRMLKVSAISEDKKKEIVEKIRKEGEAFLGKSQSFMRKLRPAHAQSNLKETTSLQRAAWSQPWLLNMLVRKVFQREIPNLVQNNREAAQRRSGTQGKPGTPAKKPGDSKDTPKGNRQIGGRWYRENGSPFTTQEVLAGKHLQTS